MFDLELYFSSDPECCNVNSVFEVWSVPWVLLVLMFIICIA